VIGGIAGKEGGRHKAFTVGEVRLLLGITNAEIEAPGLSQTANRNPALVQ